MPVMLKSPNAEVMTYAMLGTCCTGTFVLEELQQQLELEGVDSHVQVKTMNGQKLHSVKVLRNLTVTNLDGRNSMNLPKVYTKDEIPTTVQEVPRP